MGITQSMSSAGCPYDNAPMEIHFNTLKNKLIYHYVWIVYNKVRNLGDKKRQKKTENVLDITKKWTGRRQDWGQIHS